MDSDEELSDRANRWFENSGAKALAEESTVAYNEYCRRVQQPGALQIDDARDSSVNEDSDLSAQEVQEYLPTVRRIISAYTIRNPRVGYVQGHCDIISFLLGVLGAKNVEHKIFWVYTAVMERLLPLDFFSRNPKLQGLHVDVEVLPLLLSLHIPDLKHRLSKDEISSVSSMLAFKWFATLWVNELQFPALLFVWDRMLVSKKGSIVHFITALAIISSSENYIAKSVRLEDSDSSILVYKAVIKKAHSILDIQRIIEAFEVDLNIQESRIEEMREEVRAIPQFEEQEINALHGVTHFNKNQLEQLQVEFRLLKESVRQQTGKQSRGIDKRTLGQILGRVVPEWPSQAYTQLFQVLEADSLGCVDFQRLMLALSVLCRGTVEEKLKLCFDLYDSRKKGFLDVTDMILLAGSLSKIFQYKVYRPSKNEYRRHNHQIQESMDDNCASISKRELRTLSSDGSTLIAAGHGSKSHASKPRILSTTFVSSLLNMDTNGNKKVTLHEWNDGALQDPYIMQCLNIENEIHDAKSSRPCRQSLSSDFQNLLLSKETIISDKEKLNESVEVVACDKRRISLLSPGASVSNIAIENDSPDLDILSLVDNKEPSRRKQRSCKCVIS